MTTGTTTGTTCLATTIDATDSLLRTFLAPLRAYAVHAAVALGLPDLVRSGIRSADDLARETGTDRESLGRLVRMLESLGIVTRGPGGLRLTSAGELLCRGVPNSMYDLALLYGEQAYPVHAELLHTVRTGEQAFPHVFGANWLEHLRQYPEIGRRFDRAMNAGDLFFRALAEAVGSLGVDSLVDVGGGNGVLIRTVLDANPSMAGVLADLPRAVEPVGRRIAAAVDDDDRLVVRPTDFFIEVPPGYDAYLLSRILHDWSDGDGARILANCRAAMRAGAMLLICERLVPEDGRSSPAFDWDLHMMTTTGGRERTFAEYQTLLDGAGFGNGTTVALPLGFSLLIATAT